MRKSKKKKANNIKLDEAKQEEMFAAYAQKPCVAYVAEVCRVSETTARKYRKLNNWDERVTKVQEKTREKVETDIVKRNAENLKIVHFAKAHLVSKIRSGTDKSTSTYSELDKLIRLEGFLLGKPDSRPDVSKYEQMSDAELKKRLEELKKLQSEL